MYTLLLPACNGERFVLVLVQSETCGSQEKGKSEGAIFQYGDAQEMYKSRNGKGLKIVKPLTITTTTIGQSIGASSAESRASELSVGHGALDTPSIAARR